MSVDTPLTAYGEDPFPEERLTAFNSQEIIDELKCGICMLIGVDAVECALCQQLFCSFCANQIQADAKKKGIKDIRCPSCNKAPWNLNNLHRMYKKALERLNFRCCDENCIASFTISSYKDHQHVYLEENQIMYGYSMKSKGGVLQQLDTYLSKIIEEKKSDINEDKQFEAIIGKKLFRFDLRPNPANLMKVVSSETKEEYTLMRQQFTKPKVHDSYRWIWWNNDSCSWEPYTLLASDRIEQKFLEYFFNPTGKQTNFILEMMNISYQINFQYFSQERVDTKFRRSIFRCPVVEKLRFVK